MVNEEFICDVEQLLKIYRGKFEDEDFKLPENVCLNVNDKYDLVDRLLIWECRIGNPYTKEIFVRDKIDFVKKVIKYDKEILSYKNRGLDDEDLFQVGMIGVLYTLRRYDFRKDVKVRTFLANNIRFSIRNDFRKYGAVSVSREAGAVYKKCFDKIDILDDKISSNMLEQLSQNMKIERTKILESFLAIKSRNSMCYFTNEEVVDADSYSVDKYFNNVFRDYKEKTDMSFDYRIVLDAMHKLPRREFYIIKRIFIDDRTQIEVARELNISVTTVGKIKKRAIEFIRAIVCEKESD